MLPTVSHGSSLTKDSIVIEPQESLRGEVTLPGDKSIAHRAAMVAAISNGNSILDNFPRGKDTGATLKCLTDLGIKIIHSDNSLNISGNGLYGLKESEVPLNAENSGSTIRFLAGLLAGQQFDSEIIGDESLSKRPMRRVVDPLNRMGAQVECTVRGTAPIKIVGRGKLKPITYKLPVGSAQVKTALIFAALYADGRSDIVENQITRDHTERLLNLSVQESGFERRVTVSGGMKLSPRRYSIPGDPSTGAYFIAAALITPNSSITLRKISLNPTRITFLEILKKMGGKIDIINTQTAGNEPVGDIAVSSSGLNGYSVRKEEVSMIIDEIPVLAVAAAASDSHFSVRNATELRYKESDRISSTVINLRSLGINVWEYEDGFEITGGILRGSKWINSFGDHRIAMAMTIAALASKRESVINNADAVNISYPDFYTTISRLTAL